MGRDDAPRVSHGFSPFGRVHCVVHRVSLLLSFIHSFPLGSPPFPPSSISHVASASASFLVSPTLQFLTHYVLSRVFYFYKSGSVRTAGFLLGTSFLRAVGLHCNDLDFPNKLEGK